MTDQELMALMLQFDPQTKRIPPGVRAIADAVLAEAQKQIRKEQIYCSQQFARIKELEAEVAGYQLCAAEKQAEIDALTARIATLEQQRQQDREDAARYRWLCCKKIIPNPSLWDSGVGFLCHLKGLPSSGAATSEQLAGAIDAARAKEPSNET